MRRVPAALLSLLALALLPATASAATVIGALPPDGATYQPAACPAGTGGIVWRLPATNGMTTYPGPPYQVPAGGGVITKFETRNIAAAGTPFRFRVMQTRVSFPAGDPPQIFATGVASVAATSAPGTGITSVGARVKVTGGEVLGLSRPAGAGDVNCLFEYTESPEAFGFRPGSGEPDDGTEFQGAGTTGYRPNVRATLEPDADNDGFGDETQDGCPSIAQLQGPCHVDVQVSAAAAEPSIPVGGVGVVTFTVTNAGASKIGAQVAMTLPPGLQLVATTAPGGCSGLTCNVGALDPGEPGLVLAVVRGVTPGAKAVSGRVSSTIGDPNPANDVASAALDVVPGAPALCRVPTLKNLSRDAASKALKAAGCKLGKSARPKRKVKRGKLRVRSQSIPARTQVAAGTKVDLTLRYSPTNKK